MPHIHLTILVSAHWSATSFSFLTGQVSLPYNILLCTQLLYNLPLIVNDTSLLVSSGTNCLYCLTCTSYRIQTASTNEWLHHFRHATLYTTALRVYPFSTTSTLQCIATSTFTADPTLPSYSLLPHLLTFCTYHNLVFIHIAYTPVYRPFVQDYPGEPVPEGKTNLDFTEARDSEWQWHQLGYMKVCTLLQTDSHTSTPALSFLQAGCPSCHPTNSVKALNAYSYCKITIID